MGGALTGRQDRARRPFPDRRWQVLTVKEAAARLRVSVALVYAMVADGRLPCVRLGRKGRRGA